MTLPDLINGLFELGGGLLLCKQVHKLYQDKHTAGVYVPATALFAAWGLWNLFYYPNLNQWLSFLGGLVVVSANIAWLCLNWHYVRKQKRKKKLGCHCGCAAK